MKLQTHGDKDCWEQVEWNFKRILKKIEEKEMLELIL